MELQSQRYRSERPSAVAAARRGGQRKLEPLTDTTGPRMASPSGLQAAREAPTMRPQQAAGLEASHGVPSFSSFEPSA
jgi:hypothetical protein